MKTLFAIFLLAFPLMLFSQNERKDIRKGNGLYEEENYGEAEIKYRKALEKQSGSYEASFNLGNSFFKQEKYGEAENQFKALQGKDMDKEDIAKVYHNLGNSLLAGGKIQESIEAYKNALRNNPTDIETKYNLSYAMNLLKDQQNQQQQQQQQQQGQNSENQKNQEQQQQQQQQQEQQQQEQQQQQQAKEEEEAQKQEQAKISKEDAERILQALENEENEVRERVEQEQAKSQRVRVLKEW